MGIPFRETGSQLEYGHEKDEEEAGDRASPSVRHIRRGLTAKLAKDILAIKFTKEETRRATELADKCNEGMLAPDERAEYSRLVNLGTELAILKSRARLFLSADRS